MILLGSTEKVCTEDGPSWAVTVYVCCDDCEEGRPEFPEEIGRAVLAAAEQAEKAEGHHDP